MGIARNINYSTIQVPALNQEQTAKLAEYISGLTVVANTEKTTVTANMLTAMQSSGISHNSHAPVDKYVKPSTKVTATKSKNLELSGVEDKTAALIIGIICAELKKNPSDLVFNSITAL